MNLKASFAVRGYQQGDEAGITALFQSVFGRPVPRGFWEWKLRTLQTNDENEWVAESDGRIVGHYAVTPIRFKLHDRQVVVPHGCDAMTHPDYRRQGILTALGRRANEVWERAGAPFQIGFHYGGWGSVRKRLGWQPLLRLVWMKRWIRPFAALAHQYHLPGARVWQGADSLCRRFFMRKDRSAPTNSGAGGLQIERVLQADDRFDHLWRNVCSDYGILAIRDRAWVQWRCLDMPGAEQYVFLATRTSEPLGYITLRVTRENAVARGTIIDWMAAPGDMATADALWHSALVSADGHGTRSLAALISPVSHPAERLRNAGYYKSRHGYDFSVIPYSSPAPASTGSDWFLTGAEGDVL